MKINLPKLREAKTVNWGNVPPGTVFETEAGNYFLRQSGGCYMLQESGQLTHFLPSEMIGVKVVATFPEASIEFGNRVPI